MFHQSCRVVAEINCLVPERSLFIGPVNSLSGRVVRKAIAIDTEPHLGNGLLWQQLWCGWRHGVVPCAILGSTNSFKLLQITRLGPRADCCTAGEGVTNEQLCTC